MKQKNNNVLHNVSEKFSVEDFMKNDSIHEFAEKYQISKNNLLDSMSRKDAIKKMQKRKILVAAAAGVLVFGVPVSVFAAKQIMTGLQVNKQQTNNYEYEYSFSDTENQSTEASTEASTEVSPLFHSVVKLQFGYLPDGYQPINNAKNKFNLNGDPGCNQGISVRVLTLNTDQKVTVDNAVSSKDMKVGDKAATLFYKNVTSDKAFDKDMIIFFNEYGYGVEIFAQVGVTEEELMKVADDIQLVACDMAEADAIGAPEQSGAKTESMPASMPIKTTSNVFDTSQMVDAGKEFSLSTQPSFYSSDLAFTVEGLEVRDSIAGLTDKGFGFDLQDIQRLVNADGTLQPYTHRDIITGDRKNTVDQVVGEEQRPIKLVYVTMKVRNTSAMDVSSIKIAPQICCLTDTDGQLTLPLPPDHYSSECIQPGGYAVYCDQPTMYDMDPQTYSRKMYDGQRYLIPAGKEIEYHVAFIVDADKMNNMVLFFNPTGRIGTTDSDKGKQAIIKLY